MAKYGKVIVFLLALLIAGCKPSAVHEAERDYYDGRLLKEKGDYPKAMECFVAATKVRTKDYKLLGRVWTNIGDICHKEGSFDLSYEMFDKAAKSFLLAKDSIAYCYALCDKAIEAVHNHDLEQAHTLLKEIDSTAYDTLLLAHVDLTRALMYRHQQQYDSALYFANKAQQGGLTVCTVDVVKAQAFSFLGQKDSAVWYAHKAVETSSSLFELNNMYYILTNDDEKQDVETIRRLNGNRADIQKAIEIRQGELTRAVEILRVSLNKPHNWIWLYVLVSIIALIAAGIIAIRTRQRHNDIRQELIVHQAFQKQMAAEYRNRYNVTLNAFNDTCEILRGLPDFKHELHWNDYDAMCAKVNVELSFLAAKLRRKDILTESEVRLCILVVIDFSYRQIADILPYALKGVGKLKFTAAKKLHTSTGNLRKTLVEIALEDLKTMADI